MESQTNVLIFGTGGIGGFYGLKLLEAGANVTFICRSNYDTIKQNGMTLTSPLGNRSFKQVQCINTPDNLQNTPDIVLVTTKCIDIDNIAKQVHPYISPQTPIGLIQNGIGIEPQYRHYFPTNPLISGLAFICVSQPEPGHIDHQDYGRIVIGSYLEPPHPLCHTLQQLFERQSINCKVSDDIVKERWKKLIWNAPFNPISILAGQKDTLALLSVPECKALITNVMKNVVAIANADGLEIATSLITKNITDTEKMAAYKTSMLLDYENGRPLEIHAILGNAVRIAQRHNIEIPHLETVYALATTL